MSNEQMRAPLRLIVGGSRPYLRDKNIIELPAARAERLDLEYSFRLRAAASKSDRRDIDKMETLRTEMYAADFDALDLCESYLGIVFDDNDDDLGPDIA